ncbi:MAG: class I SAM-dependent methyltransferase, partial [Saprospiraceae bacterium]
ATQFLLEHFSLKKEENKILDLASGNGVIAHHINHLKDNLEIHLMDDSYLAVESSKLNLKGENIHFHYNHSLEEFEDNYFDLIISNPPFHFEHEIDINIPLQLFKEAYQKLKSNGRLVIVANSHLNYGTHLIKIFGKFEVLAKNDKFEVLEAKT